MKKWFVVDGKQPKWVRSVAVDENGTVFVPAAVAAGEGEIMLCASYDGEPIVLDRNHIYVRSDWMAKEYKHTADFCERVQSRLKPEIDAIIDKTSIKPDEERK